MGLASAVRFEKRRTLSGKGSTNGAFSDIGACILVLESVCCDAGMVDFRWRRGPRLIDVKQPVARAGLKY